MAALDGDDHNKTTDRLSALPDDILVDVLSLLPLNSAATTSVLSRRWELLWTRLTSLHLDKRCFPRPLEMYTTLNQIFQRRNSSKLHALYVDALYPLEGTFDDCSSYLYSFLNHISELQLRKIKIRVAMDYLDHKHYPLKACPNERTSISNPLLHLQLDVGPSFFTQLLRLPASLLNNPYLVSLKLDRMLEIDMPADNFIVNLPNLTKLYLLFDYFPYKLLEELIKACPELKKLTVLANIKDSVGSLLLSSRKLEYLHLFVELDNDGEFVIDAPNLKHLRIISRERIIYRFVSKPSKLISLNWEGGNDHITKSLEIVQRFSGVKYLWINSDVLKVFKQLFHDSKLPFFENLTLLRIILGDPEAYWNDVFLSVRHSPRLECLEVMQSILTAGVIKWVEPDLEVLRKPLTRLKKIRLEGLGGTSDDLAMINYFLKNGETLKLLVVGCSIRDKNAEGIQLWQEYKFCQQLFELSKPSADCEVQFHGEFLSSSSKDFKTGTLDCQIHDFQPRYIGKEKGSWPA